MGLLYSWIIYAEIVANLFAFFEVFDDWVLILDCLLFFIFGFVIGKLGLENSGMEGRVPRWRCF